MKSILDKFDFVSSTSSTRWFLLVITWILVFILYLVVLTESVSYRHCLSVSEVWLDAGSLVSPFFMFCVMCGLLFVWAVVEHWLVWLSPMGSRKAGLIITSLFMFLLAGWSIMLFRHWQMLEIEQGKLSFENYLFKAMDAKSKKYQSIDWEGFLILKRCKEGIELANLSDEDWCKLVNEFYGRQGIRIVDVCSEPPISRSELWREEQDEFKFFMEEYKRLLKEEIEK